MKLVVVGQASCRPCKIMHNIILEHFNRLENMNADYEYIDLQTLEDKDVFIQLHGLTSTPTTWIEKDGMKVKEFTGYVDVDTIFEIMEECK